MPRNGTFIYIHNACPNFSRVKYSTVRVCSIHKPVLVGRDGRVVAARLAKDFEHLLDSTQRPFLYTKNWASTRIGGQCSKHMQFNY